MTTNKIHNIDVVEGLKNLEDNSCDIIILDPPYNIGKDFGNNKTLMTIKDYVEWSKKWLSECERVLKDGGTMFIYGFSEILAYLSVEITLDKRWLIWHYTNKNVPSLKFWQRSHESIICCWKNNPTFNLDDVRVPYTETFLKNSAGKKRTNTSGRFGNKETVYNANEKGALPRDVLKFPALAGGSGRKERWFYCHDCKEVYEPSELKNHKEHNVEKHPTQKPLELSKHLIKSAKIDNGLVLVPFVGSGSECVAAKELGMNYIGFEINEIFIQICNKRLS
jgi:site-specific DNA-methyltransferase (adenine-specific)